MKKLCLALFLLTACSRDDGTHQDSNGAAPATPAAANEKAAPALGTLVGLYEGGSSDRPHQMCVTESGGETRFGLVVWGSNDHSCSGSGTVARDGATLRLRMTGDEACTLSASISGNSITMPSDLPAGCAYYCGARAQLSGARLTQTGTTAADAAKAKDLVGEPLCGGG